MTATTVTEQHAALMRRHFVEHWNGGNPAVADEVYAPDFVAHGSPNPAIGPDGVRRFVADLRAAFPDLHYTIEDLIATDDKVVVRWTMRGTHRGELMGLPPTDKAVALTGISINRFAGGKSVESWDQTDIFGLLGQLGIIPPPPGR